MDPLNISPSHHIVLRQQMALEGHYKKGLLFLVLLFSFYILSYFLPLLLALNCMPSRGLVNLEWSCPILNYSCTSMEGVPVRLEDTSQGISLASQKSYFPFAGFQCSSPRLSFCPENVDQFWCGTTKRTSSQPI